MLVKLVLNSTKKLEDKPESILPTELILSEESQLTNRLKLLKNELLKATTKLHKSHKETHDLREKLEARDKENVEKINQIKTKVAKTMVYHHLKAIDKYKNSNQFIIAEKQRLINKEKVHHAQHIRSQTAQNEEEKVKNQENQLNKASKMSKFVKYQQQLGQERKNYYLQQKQLQLEQRLMIEKLEEEKLKKEKLDKIAKLREEEAMLIQLLTFTQQHQINEEKKQEHLNKQTQMTKC